MIPSKLDIYIAHWPSQLTILKESSEVNRPSKRISTAEVSQLSPVDHPSEGFFSRRSFTIVRRQLN